MALILKKVPATIAQTNSQTAQIDDPGVSTNASNSHKWSPKKSFAPSSLTQDCTILEHRDWIGKMKDWLGFYDDIQPTEKETLPYLKSKLDAYWSQRVGMFLNPAESLEHNIEVINK